jgi:dTDP-4-amino-4,6-dideoxygalactose transaminase
VVQKPETRTDLIRLARPDVGDEELAEIREVLESGQLPMGRHVRAPSARQLPEPGLVPGADVAFEQALALPLHARLSDGELDRVAEALDKLVSHH